MLEVCHRSDGSVIRGGTDRVLNMVMSVRVLSWFCQSTFGDSDATAADAMTLRSFFSLSLFVNDFGRRLIGVN